MWQHLVERMTEEMRKSKKWQKRHLYHLSDALPFAFAQLGREGRSPLTSCVASCMIGKALHGVGGVYSVGVPPLGLYSTH